MFHSLCDNICDVGRGAGALTVEFQSWLGAWETIAFMRSRHELNFGLIEGLLGRSLILIIAFLPVCSLKHFLNHGYNMITQYKLRLKT